MSLRAELLATVAAAFEDHAAERVSRVVKPPAADTGGSSFTTLALSGGGVGVSYNLFHRDPAALAAFRAWDTSAFEGADALEVAGLVLSEEPFERTIGVAALNALSQSLIREDPEAYGIDFSSSLDDLLAFCDEDVIGMVGYFTPTIRELRGRIGELIVLEKEPALLAANHPFTVTDDPSALKRCNKILMTGTTVINESLPGLVPYTSGARVRVVMGPSAGFIPGPLFDLGIDIVGGIFIDDPQLFVERFATGIKWGDAARKIWHLKPGFQRL